MIAGARAATAATNLKIAAGGDPGPLSGATPGHGRMAPAGRGPARSPRAGGRTEDHAGDSDRTASGTASGRQLGGPELEVEMPHGPCLRSCLAPTRTRSRAPSRTVRR
jgi:hypothetical protein